MKSKSSTLVIGASENPERYSNMAIKLLRKYRHSVVAIGNKSGKVEDVEIQKELHRPYGYNCSVWSRPSSILSIN